LRRLADHPAPADAPRRDGLQEHGWDLGELARAIPMPPVTLYNWVRPGWVRGRQEATHPHRWILWADAAELDGLRERHQRPAGYYTRRRWLDEAPTPGPSA